MKKIAIFNVGGALSAYAQIDDVQYLIDLGGGNDFSPTNDFLLPLSKRGVFRLSKSKTTKYHIDQVLLSHLDNDHISDFLRFNEYFQPQLLTAPSNHPDISDDLKLDDSKIADTETVRAILADMHSRIPGSADMRDEVNPLAVCDNNTMHLSYLPPKICEELDGVSTDAYSHYSNNTSLALLIKTNNHSVFFPGDLMPDGMDSLLENDNILHSLLQNNGVDFLIAPHHGLSSSFPTSLFGLIKNNKVILSIISEKAIKKSDTENRSDVDQRYYSDQYAMGYDVIDGKPGMQYGIITSKGHIVIDLEPATATVKRCVTNEELIEEFV